MIIFCFPRAAHNNCIFFWYRCIYMCKINSVLTYFLCFSLCCICLGEICSLWRWEAVIFSWLTFLYNYLAPMCPRLCKISVLLLLIALPHPQHVHLQQLPSTCKQGQPQSQQEDSIIRVLKCLQALKLRFSQAISDVVCLSFDASFNTFRTGLFIAKGSRPRSAGPRLGVWLGTWSWGVCWSNSSWVKSSVKQCLSLSALDELHAKWIIACTLPLPFLTAHILSSFLHLY